MVPTLVHMKENPGGRKVITFSYLYAAQASNFVGFIFILTERKLIDYKNQLQLKGKLWSLNNNRVFKTSIGI